MHIKNQQACMVIMEYMGNMNINTTQKIPLLDYEYSED